MSTLHTAPGPWVYASRGVPAWSAMAALVIIANSSITALFRGTVIGYFPHFSFAFAVQAELSG